MGGLIAAVWYTFDESTNSAVHNMFWTTCRCHVKPIPCSSTLKSFVSCCTLQAMLSLFKFTITSASSMSNRGGSTVSFGKHLAKHQQRHSQVAPNQHLGQKAHFHASWHNSRSSDDGISHWLAPWATANGAQTWVPFLAHKLCTFLNPHAGT